MKLDACPSTLLLRSKRVLLPHAEALALDAHLGVCEDCRVLALAMSDFDAVAVSDRQDAQRIERLAAAARQHTLGLGRNVDAELRWLPRLPLRRRFTRALLAALALSLAVAGASAALFVAGAANESEVRNRVLDQPLERAEQAGAAVVRVGRGLARQSDVVSHNPLGDTQSDNAARSESTSRVGATVLFKEANEARRGGDTARATTLYRELQRRHPASREAQLSLVSLGHLLLSTGRASAALSQFDAALRASAARSVKAEALYGRALSLSRLGQADAERSAWELLLREFPASPYAAQARRRLGKP